MLKYFSYSEDGKPYCTHPLVVGFEIEEGIAKMYIGEFNQQFFDGDDRIKKCDDYLQQVFDVDRIKFKNENGAICILPNNQYITVEIGGFSFNVCADHVLRVFIHSDFVSKLKREDLITGKEYTIKSLLLDYLTKRNR